MNAKDILKTRKSKGEWSQILLKATDIPVQPGFVILSVLEVSMAPRTWHAPVVLHVEPTIADRTALALNVSNLRAIADALGEDLDSLIGKRLKFRREQVLMTGTGMVASIVFDSEVTEAQTQAIEKAKARRGARATS